MFSFHIYVFGFYCSFSQAQFQMEGHSDELFIDNSKTTTKPEKAQLTTGKQIKFVASDVSDGKTEFKISFKKEGTDDPKIDPNKCKPFCFEWDETFVRTEANKKIPSRMMDDIGPKIEAGKKVPRIFRYAGPSSKSKVAGCSTYVNEGLVIQQVKSSRVPDNYFIIG